MGGAKLAWGLAQILPPEELLIVVNTGDDEEFYDLHVSPDLDTVMYTLAGLANPQTGWGIEGDSFNALDMLERYGAPAWFKLGDRDLATHIHRSRLLGAGQSLSQVTRLLCRSLGVQHRIVPMSDERLRTVVISDEGELSFQRYFVARRCRPQVRSLRFEGAGEARPAPEFAQALEQAGGIIFCPSNPFLSIGPILALAGLRERIANFSRGPRLAVSPIVRGQALRGPAGKLLGELGYEVSCLGAARQYLGLCDIFVIDEQDADQAQAISELGFQVEIAQTVMTSDQERVELANLLLRLLRD